jgi:hypothetical protein
MTPTVDFDRFWTILDPPMAYQILANFGTDFDHPKSDIFYQFIAPIYKHQFLSFLAITF